jgi:predicted RNA-binding protein with TRAM domain
VITGSTLFVGAADAGEIPKVEIESVEINMTFSVLNPKKLFMPKSFH